MKRPYFFILLLIAAFISLSVERLQAQTLVRGPYLQSSGPTSIVVCWRTDTLSESRVYYGQTSGSLTLHADGDSISTEHRVKVSGLSPRTKYYYTIGSSTQTLRGDSLMYFTTAPDPANPTPIRVWAMGDFGHGNAGASLVRESYKRFAAADHPADFWLWLGDNVYQDGKEYEYQTKVFSGPNGYTDLFPNLPFFSTSGNHDYNSICPWQDSVTSLPILCDKDPNTHDGPYFRIIEPPMHGEMGGVPSNLKLFYSFDYGDVHFICLNSELGSWNEAYDWIGICNPLVQDTACLKDTSFTSPMLEWLKADLAATTKKWKVAFWHQCPYSGQDSMARENGVQQFCVATRHHFNPILERFGVDLVLTGHDHNYQRSYLIKGHYFDPKTFTPAMMINGSSGKNALGEAYVKYTDGPLAGVGTVYVVAGNTSNVNELTSPIVHPAIYYGQACDTCLGSFILDVDGDRLDGRYITAYDQVLDEFTILKQPATGIRDNQGAASCIDISPNPFQKRTTIGYGLLEKTTVRTDVLDLSGKIVFSVPAITRFAGNYRDILDFENAGLTRGTYLVRVDCGGFVKYLKAVKVD